MSEQQKNERPAWLDGTPGEYEYNLTMYEGSIEDLDLERHEYISAKTETRGDARFRSRDRGGSGGIRRYRTGG